MYVIFIVVYKQNHPSDIARQDIAIEIPGIKGLQNIAKITSVGRWRGRGVCGGGGLDVYLLYTLAQLQVAKFFVPFNNYINFATLFLYSNGLTKL